MRTALLLRSMLKPATKKKRLAKELIGAWITHNTNENRLTFASLCDWWIQVHRQEIQAEQMDIEMIKEIYAEYLASGEKTFIKKNSNLSGIHAEIYKDIEYRRANNGKDRPHMKRTLKAH